MTELIWHGEKEYSKRVDKLPDTIDLRKALGWRDSIKRREPLILNSHVGDIFPAGHIILKCYIIVPVINEDNEIFIIGLADKETDYNDLDTNLVSILWDSAVPEIGRKRIESRLICAETTFEVAAGEAKHSKDWLKTIIDNIESLVFMKDREGRYLFVNKAFTSSFGFTMEQAIGKNTDDLNLKANRISSEADREVISKGITRTFEQNLKHIDGVERRYLTSMIPITNPMGDVYATVGLTTGSGCWVIPGT